MGEFERFERAGRAEGGDVPPATVASAVPGRRAVAADAIIMHGLLKVKAGSQKQTVVPSSRGLPRPGPPACFCGLAVSLENLCA